MELRHYVYRSSQALSQTDAPQYSIPPECIPDVTDIVIDDGAPVDGLVTEKQMRLLTEPLYSSWPGPGKGNGWLSEIGLGLRLWQGRFEGMHGTWLRWCGRDKHVIPTGAERSEIERKRTKKAVQEIKRLRRKMRDAGIEPK